MAHASFRFATSLAIIFLTSLVGCQSCYYPNGDLAANEQPCSTTGDGPCCPFQWQCLDNGLCYLDYANFFERHTCTDQTWQSPECPNICTQNGTATGNEAILQCSPGRYCCDGNRSWDCCTTADTIFFALADGNALTTIGAAPLSAPPSTPRASSNTPSNTPVAVSTPSQGPTIAPPSTSRSSSVISPTTSSAAGPSIITAPRASTFSTSDAAIIPAVVVTVQTVISSNSQGMQTVFITTAPTSSPVRANSNLGTILGCAIGIPLGIAALSLLAFLLLRRRRKQARKRPSASDEKPDLPQNHPTPAVPQQPETTESAIRTSEIYGKPVQSPGGVPGKAELPASPSLSVTSSLPAYSPDMHTAQWSQPVTYKPYRPVYELPGE